jgi:hypothetical protein
MAVLATPATLDLRPLSAYRGDDSGRAGEAKSVLILPRKHVNLTLYLPVGSDEGQYTLQFFDGPLRTLLMRQLIATLQNHVVTANADLDLRSLSPGVHTLAIQRIGDEWRTYSVVLQ